VGAPPPQRLGQQGLDPPGLEVTLDLGVPGQGPDPDPRLVGADIGQLAEPVDVDQGGRSREPHRQQGHQALPTGENLGVRVRLEGGERLVETGRPDVGEGGGLHGVGCPPSRLCGGAWSSLSAPEGPTMIAPPWRSLSAISRATW
jgi:hypothetical protein